VWNKVFGANFIHQTLQSWVWYKITLMLTTGRFCITQLKTEKRRVIDQIHWLDCDMPTFEACIHSISLGHDNLSQVSTIKLGICHQCCCQTLALQVFCIIWEVTKPEIKKSVGNSICLPNGVSYKCLFTSEWVVGQWRQPHLCTAHPGSMLWYQVMLKAQNDL